MTDGTPRTNPNTNPNTNPHASPHTILLPDGWTRPSGYSNGIAARGRILSVAGQIGWNGARELARGDFVGQVKQALQNIVAVLAAGGARPEHIVRLTWYVTDIARYRSEVAAIGAVYRETIGSHYPAMSAVGVTALVEPDALVEIEATAVVPD